MIGLTVQYNADHTAEVIDQNETHLLVRMDTGDKYCVSKTSIDKTKILR